MKNDPKIRIRRPSQNERIISVFSSYQCWAYAGHVKKWSKDLYPADERIVHLPTVSSGQCFVLLPTESSDQWFVHLPDTDLWIIFHVTCIGSVLVARGNRNDSFIFRLGLRIRIFGSFPTWPAFNESFLFPWLSLCKSRCVATRKWTNLFLRGLVTLESL